MTAVKWFRVTRKEPCAICHKGDWCTRSADGAACCMRTESDRPMRNGGWLHKSDKSKPVKPVVRYVAPTPQPPCAAMLKMWKIQTQQSPVVILANKLGVSVESMNWLGCVWNGREYAFPMRDGMGKIVGIRLRTPHGDQFAVKGSHAGLFIPDLKEFPDLITMYVCEGASDTAAMLTIGLPAIGRPSCLGQERDVVTWCERNGVKQVVIVADADDPGQRGAEKLHAAIPLSSTVWTPPCKDVREAVMAGLTAQLIETITRDLICKIK
jgi:hypothetical protein